MKKTTTLALALLTTFAVAQPYNRTYDVNGNNDNLTAGFVITNANKETITVSYGSDATTYPRNDYFMVTKVDINGDNWYNTRVYTNSSPTQGFTHVEAMIQTDDKGVMVAGYFYKDSKHVEQPFITKLDYYGNVLWTKIYTCNVKAMPNSGFNKMSFCRVFDNSDENYLLVANGDSDADPGSSVAVNVIKVDQNGKPIFINKYYDANATFPVTRDYPGDIEYSTKDKLYMITGRRLEANAETKKQDMFFMKITESGIVAGSFITVTAKSVPVDQDMVYDEVNDQFAVTFTHQKNQYVTSISSVMGFLTTDINLNLSNTNYYWHSEGDQHNSRSISLRKEGYVICSDIYETVNTKIHNPSWLKLKTNGDLASSLIRYNVKDDAYFGHHALTYDSNGDEAYVLANQQGNDLRLIMTDLDGASCGAIKYDPIQETWDPKKAEYDYYDKNNGSYKEYDAKWDQTTPEYRVCEEPGNNYRMANATGISAINAESVTMLYPTVMSTDNARLTVINKSDIAVKMEIHNIAGQLIFSDSKIATGTTEIQLNTNGNLSEGLYLAKIYNANGTTQITKLLITK